MELISLPVHLISQGRVRQTRQADLPAYWHKNSRILIHPACVRDQQLPDLTALGQEIQAGTLGSYASITPAEASHEAHSRICQQRLLVMTKEKYYFPDHPDQISALRNVYRKLSVEEFAARLSVPNTIVRLSMTAISGKVPFYSLYVQRQQFDLEDIEGFLPGIYLPDAGTIGPSALSIRAPFKWYMEEEASGPSLGASLISQAGFSLCHPNDSSNLTIKRYLEPTAKIEGHIKLDAVPPMEESLHLVPLAQT